MIFTLLLISIFMKATKFKISTQNKTYELYINQVFFHGSDLDIS